MRHLLTLFLLLGAFSAYAQSVLVDSCKEGTSFGDPPRGQQNAAQILLYLNRHAAEENEFAKADGLISEALMYARNWNVA